MLVRNERTDGGRWRHGREFATFGEFVARAELASNLPDNERSSRRDSYGFSLTDTFGAAVELYRNGWHDGRAHVQEISASLIETVSNRIIRQNITYDVTGDVIDIGRFCDGEPEHWMRFEDEISTGPGNRLLTVVANITASAKVPPSTLIARGAAVVALVELLEYAGHRVAVRAVGSTDNRKKKSLPNAPADVYETFIDLKKHDEPLNIDEMTFALVHPSTLRRLWFGVAEMEPATIRNRFGFNIHKTYGRPRDVAPAERGDIYFPVAYSGDGSKRWDDLGWVRSFLSDELKKSGVHLRETAVQ